MKRQIYLFPLQWHTSLLYQRHRPHKLETHSIVSGVPNYRISECSDKEFDDYRFFSGKDCNDGDDHLTVVVKEKMKRDATANAMLDSSNKKRYVALCINFDTGKSTIKLEPKPIIAQIVNMLNSNPDLKFGVEGHTHNVGNPKSNRIPSEEVAKPVHSAIVEEGRAKNRRVEIVKKPELTK